MPCGNLFPHRVLAAGCLAVILTVSGCEQRQDTVTSASPRAARTHSEETPAKLQRLTNPPIRQGDADMMLTEAGESLRLSPLTRKLTTIRYSGVVFQDHLGAVGLEAWAEPIWRRLVSASLTQLPAAASAPAGTLSLVAKMEISADDSPAFPPGNDQVPIRLALVLYDAANHLELWRHEYCTLAWLAPEEMSTTTGYKLPTANSIMSTPAGPVQFADAELALRIRVERAALLNENGAVQASLDLTSSGRGEHISLEATFVDSSGQVVSHTPPRPYFLPADQTVRLNFGAADSRAVSCRTFIRKD